MNPTTTAAVAVGAVAAAHLFDRTAAAQYLGVSPKTMLRFAVSRRLPVVRMCRKLLFKRTDLERFVDEHVVASRARHRYERP